MNKSIKTLLIGIIVFFGFSHYSFAIKINANSSDNSFKVVNGKIVKNIKTDEIFHYFSKFFETSTPQSYQYIQLNFQGIQKKSQLEKSLKILVYNNKIKNLSAPIYAEKSMNAYNFYRLSALILGTDISNINKDTLIKRNTASNDLDLVKHSYYLIKQQIENDKKGELEKNRLFKNVYETIKNEHYNKAKIKDRDLVYSAIEGLAKGTKDKHTVYFPPTKNKVFKQTLSGDYEGIGAYVDLKEPGVFIVISPISGSPSEKAGLKGGDRIIQVGDKKVTKENSSAEIISWIKGPAGTVVRLTILRGGKELKIDVKRAKIHISNIDYEIKNNSVHYIKIKNFGNKASKEFSDVLKKVKDNSSIKKIVIDLRNNGGGFLEEVTHMLSYVVPKGENLAIIKYLGSEKAYTSKGYNYIDLNNYDVVILQNSGTASASEIMIGTLKDYFKNIQTIGEKSYGKGSVQTIKSYSDGSSFKYTVAKWFTGKSKTGIDEVGIKPDIILEFDQENFNTNAIDNQLEKALQQ